MTTLAEQSERLLRLLENLVGEKAFPNASLPHSALKVLSPTGSGLGYSQLNELLLILGFDRVTRSFFQFLIDGSTEYQDGASIKNLAALEVAVERCRQVGLLYFGNVKHAFKVLAGNVSELESRVERLRPINVSRFKARHAPVSPIQPISSTQTYFLGYMIEDELKSRLEANPHDAQALDQEATRQQVVEIGKANQDAYLASDHLDVYVATSMRQRHEYLATSRLANEIFTHSALSTLKLRWFDPTMAYCKERLDKGLSEALMLRRARCTIYLAQESDTLGKDSELASTLAQGKPVIAFVPEVDPQFTGRLVAELKQAYPSRDVRELMLEQLQIFEPSAAWIDPSVRQWLAVPATLKIPALKARLNAAIKKHYDKRAKTLREIHPLGVQVNLETGVANGVLVVRTVDDCAKLVRRIVTRTLKFKISEEKGALVLRESISGCIFRLATNDPMLTNAFWNFYLASEE